jgi:DNA polymerase
VTPEAIRALKLRLELSRSSVKKLNAIVDRVSPDGRLRNNYKYYGAHTGRWSGEGVQLQNLPRKASKWGDFEVDIRACFQAPRGKKLVVADLSSIETRVLAWLAQCSSLLNIFAQGLDPYIDFASFMFSTPYSDVTKEQRQTSKPAVLGCGYMLSGGDIRMDCCGKLAKENYYGTQKPEDVCYCPSEKRGDEFKSGLWGYSENMGVPLDQSTCHDAVTAYRMKYQEVVRLWYALEDAAVKAMTKSERAIVYPNICFEAVKTDVDKLLIVTLPSGRRLHYIRARVEEGKFKRPSVTHHVHAQTGWHREQLYGGLLTENLVQAISRDVLAEGMKRAKAAGMTIVGHTHDEIICEEFASLLENTALELLVDRMTKPMPWAPDLPLKAEGYEAKVYKK